MSRRRVLVVLLAVVLAAVIEVAASMAWPATVPRLAVLPRPETTEREVECNTVTRYWNRHGLFWEAEDFSTLVGCNVGPGGIGTGDG